MHQKLIASAFVLFFSVSSTVSNADDIEIDGNEWKMPPLAAGQLIRLEANQRLDIRVLTPGAEVADWVFVFSHRSAKKLIDLQHEESWSHVNESGRPQHLLIVGTHHRRILPYQVLHADAVEGVVSLGYDEDSEKRYRDMLVEIQIHPTSGKTEKQE